MLIAVIIELIKLLQFKSFFFFHCSSSARLINHFFSGQQLDYQLPYYDCVPDDPSIEEMRVIVCDVKRRPLAEDTWYKYEVRIIEAKLRNP